MIRVLMIAPTPFFSDRGCHVRIFEEARFLTDRGHEVRIVTYPVGYDPPGVSVRRTRAVSWCRRTEPGPAWSRLALDAMVLKEAWSEVRSFKPDLVHAHLHEGCLIGSVLNSWFNLPLIFDYQGSMTAESIDHGFIRETGFAAGIFKSMENLLDRAPDMVIANSTALAAPLFEAGMDVRIVPDGVDPGRFSPGGPDPVLAEKLGLPKDLPVAVYLGVMSDYQGTDIILEAAGILRDREENIHFLMMGYPEAEYRKRAAALGIDDMITFTGRMNYFEAAQSLRLGSVALAPKLARTEGNGKVLLYMACGLPVVAFDLPINREILGDDAMWVRPERDCGACAARFADALTMLLHDHKRAESMASRARRRACDNLSMEAAGERLLIAYRSVLESREAGRRSRLRKIAGLGFHQFERAAAFLDLAARKARAGTRGQEALDREALHWSRAGRSAILAWQDHPAVRAYVNRRVSGDPSVDWLSFFAREFGGQGFARALNLGCGFGGLEEHALSIGLVERFTSLDISANAIASAQERLAAMPVEFITADINRITLQPESFDVAFASSSLHHIVELEHVLAQVEKGLKPGGLFVINEFVGPSRFQWTEAQLAITNRLLAAMPSRHRKNLWKRFGLKFRVYRAPLDETSRDSPFEAARSQDIVPLVSSVFEVVMRRDYGGAILHPLLDGIAGNFDPERVEDRDLLMLLAALEENLEAAGRIQSDFTMIVARKRRASS